MTISVDALFTPAQSGVGTNPNLVAPSGTWLAKLLAIANVLGLQTTSWQPGSPERTILAVDAVANSQTDAIISQMAQGGFLDSAASGTVSLTNIDGTVTTFPVTPDPSNPSQNPNGTLGWLDVVGISIFNTFRLLPTYASGVLYILNASINTYSYAAGLYHVANTNTGSTYTNASFIIITPSPTILNFNFIVVESTDVLFTTPAPHGLNVGDVVYMANFIGLTGVNNVFAVVLETPSAELFSVGVEAGGAWTGGGQVWKCSSAQFAADVLGPNSNAAAGSVTTTVTQNLGVLIDNLSSWSAANYESNAAYAARCKASFALRSPNGPSQAYTYTALSAASILAAQTPPVTLTNGPFNAAITYANTVTGVVTLVVSSLSPASTVLGNNVVPGCVQLPLTAATFATPIAITTSAPHGLTTGNTVTIKGVRGNVAANGVFTIIVTGVSTFTLVGSTGSAAYTAGGTVDGGDLGQLDALIQSTVVPDNTTEVTASALAFPLAISATVVVPAAYVTTYQNAVAGSLQALLASYPIGGLVPTSGPPGAISMSVISGALVDAGVLSVGAASYVIGVNNLAVNGVTDPTASLFYPTPSSIALLTPPSIIVVGA